MHTPVLLHEVLETLDPHPGNFVIDGTVDGGGHATALLERIGSHGKFLGIDWDAGMINAAKQKFSHAKDAAFVSANYADLPTILLEYRLGKANSLLLDLGFSSEQLESANRGFSFKKSEPLLMTYDESRPPVKMLIRELTEAELADIIFKFGEERYARRIAKAIKEAGRKKKIETSDELATVVAHAVPGGYERGRIHPATRTFQALRIYANGELENIERILSVLPQILVPGGRIAIITFHSLEDRIVKTEFRKLEKEGIVRLITKKPLIATRAEIEKNPRSRSAKLRVAELVKQNLT